MRGSQAGSRGQKRKRSTCSCEGVKSASEPMVQCDGCKGWFHFGCIGLSETDAEDMAVFICENCGPVEERQTLMFWDRAGPGNLLHDFDSESDASGSEMDLDHRPHDDSHALSDKSDDDDDDVGMSSGDDYAEESNRPLTVPGKTRPSRISGRRLHTPEAEVDVDRSPVQRASKSIDDVRHSGRQLNGIQSGSGRARDAAAVADDPVRKYCYGKLLEVILPMFEEHFVPNGSTAQDAAVLAESGASQVHQAFASSQSAATAFVEELEWHLFDTFAEYDDKKRKRIAAAKYRERFRTLTFNLAQSDRTSLRRRIGGRQLLAKVLATMSSTDLANEERQHEIEIARRESLQHSILEAAVVPTAKITHKGEEIIEAFTAAYDPRRSEQTSVEGHSKSPERYNGAMSPDLPSPTTDHGRVAKRSASVETHLEQAVQSSVGVSLNMPSDSPVLPSADSSSDSVASRAMLTLTPGEGEALHADAARPSTIAKPSSSSPITPSHPNFSLNTLWSEYDIEGSSRLAMNTVEMGLSDSDPTMDDTFLDALEDANLDELLAADEQDVNSVPDVETGQAPSLQLYSRPIIWRGELVMPMDPAPALICSVTARQVGGPWLGDEPLTWNFLFTAPSVRIEGRVAVPSSTHYLLTMRMTASKELVAVAIAPREGADRTDFDHIFEFLYSRQRHGIVFPWGIKPSEAAVGKDLYLVPLKATDAIPEYVQLLDHLELPGQRAENIFLGIFVLHKARVPRPQSHQAIQPDPPYVPMLSTLESVAVPVPLPGGTVDVPTASMAEVTQDLARLTPEQLQLVQALIEQANLHSGLNTTLASMVLPTMPAPPVPVPYQSVHFPDHGGPAPPSFVQASIAGRGSLHNIDNTMGAPYSPTHGASVDWSSGESRWGRGRGSPPERSEHARFDAGGDRQRYDRRDSRRGHPFDPRPRDSGWGSRGRGRGG